VGVLEIPEEEVVQKGRLLPGKMFLIDFNKGRMLTDEEYKGELIAKRSLAPPCSSLLLLPRARCAALLLLAPPPSREMRRGVVAS